MCLCVSTCTQVHAGHGKCVTSRGQRQMDELKENEVHGGSSPLCHFSVNIASLS